MKEEGDFEIETGEADSTYNNFDFNTPEGKVMAQMYAKRYQEKSDRIATLVNEEVEKTNRTALGVNQRQKGFGYCRQPICPLYLLKQVL